MQRRIKLIGIATSVGIFILCFILPSYFHPEFLYSMVVLMTIWLKGNRSTFDASVGLSILIIAGYFFSKESKDVEVFSALILPILFTWAFTLAIIKYKQTQENLFRSTENLNAMFLYATEGIIISNKKGQIIMANPRSCEQFGYEYGKLTGRTIEELIPKRFAGSHPENRQKYYSDSKNRSMGKGLSLYAKKSDGSEFPVEISLSSYKNKEEVFIISFIIDITERKKQEDLIEKAKVELEQRVIDRTKELAEVNLSLETANIQLYGEMEERTKIEDALRDSQKLFNTIARNFPDGIICVVNKEYKILFIDGKELQSLNIKKDTSLDLTLNQLPFFQNQNELTQQLQHVFNWENVHFDYSYDNEFYSINGVPLPDTKGFIKEILLVIQNVTEIRKAELELFQSLKKEKELNELKSKFVSLASHEFRTPLSTILTSVSLINRYASNEDLEKRQKHIERIRISVKNLTEILNDFLSIEKLEAGIIQMNKSDFDFVNFAEDLSEEMNSISKPGQKILFSHSGASQYHSDKQHLRHICINLLNNAIKYSPENSEIIFDTTLDNNGLTIKVIDHGIGIPAEDQTNLFDRFFRAGNVTAIQGTGLGLNIVRRYVDLLNGSITFESTEDKGTTFTLNFNHT